MKRTSLHSVLVAFLLFGNCPFTMAETVDVSLGGITYNLDSESMTASVAAAENVAGDIVLPELVSYGDKSYTLTSIGEQAFGKCVDITSVSIPSTVTSIGVDAFIMCSGLVSVNIPSGVTSIEEGTFEGCRKLASIDIPSGVTTIGSYAFAYCI